MSLLLYEQNASFFGNVNTYNLIELHFEEWAVSCNLHRKYKCHMLIIQANKMFIVDKLHTVTTNACIVINSLLYRKRKFYMCILIRQLIIGCDIYFLIGCGMVVRSCGTFTKRFRLSESTHGTKINRERYSSSTIKVFRIDNEGLNISFYN